MFAAGILLHQGVSHTHTRQRAQIHLSRRPLHVESGRAVNSLRFFYFRSAQQHECRRISVHRIQSELDPQRAAISLHWKLTAGVCDGTRISALQLALFIYKAIRGASTCMRSLARRAK